VKIEIAASYNTLQIKIFSMDAKDSPQTQHAHHRKMVPRITQILGLTRWFSIVTVFSSLVGALLMFIIGAANTVEAVLRYFEIDGRGVLLNHFFTPTSPDAAPRPAANLLLLESLDNGLTGLTFLYFAYGIYALFLTNSTSVGTAPRWLKVENIGSLKKTLLEVVAVLLAIMFVRTLAEKMILDGQSQGPGWEMLIMPAGILAIAISSRLMFDRQPLTRDAGL
jgi:uncharacterized membrane protein YqhA